MPYSALHSTSLAILAVSAKNWIFFVLLQAFDSLYRSAYLNVKKQTCHIDFDRVDKGRSLTTLTRQGR